MQYTQANINIASVPVDQQLDPQPRPSLITVVRDPLLMSARTCPPGAVDRFGKHAMIDCESFIRCIPYLQGIDNTSSLPGRWTSQWW